VYRPQQGCPSVVKCPTRTGRLHVRGKLENIISYLQAGGPTVCRGKLRNIISKPFRLEGPQCAGDWIKPWEPGHLHIISYLSGRSLRAAHLHVCVTPTQNPSGMMGNSEGIPGIILDLMMEANCFAQESVDWRCITI
jgi:hypothetical protein